MGIWWKYEATSVATSSKSSCPTFCTQTQPRRSMTNPPPPKPDSSLDRSQPTPVAASQPARRGRWGGNRPREPDRLQPLPGMSRPREPDNTPQRTMPSGQAAPIGGATYRNYVRPPPPLTPILARRRFSGRGGECILTPPTAGFLCPPPPLYMSPTGRVFLGVGEGVFLFWPRI